MAHDDACPCICILHWRDQYRRRKEDGFYSLVRAVGYLDASRSLNIRVIFGAPGVGRAIGAMVPDASWRDAHLPRRLASGSQKQALGNSLATFADHTAYNTDALCADLHRFAFLLGVSDGEELFAELTP